MRNDESHNRAPLQHPCGKARSCGARVPGVKGQIHQAVESHCGAACSCHREQNPADLNGARNTLKREECAHESKRQSKQSMFNLDHLQQDQYFLEHLLTMHSAVRLLDRDEAILPKDLSRVL